MHVIIHTGSAVAGLPLLIDRQNEQHALLGLLQAGQPQLALLTGRRRVGKTYLLTHAWGTQPFFLFTAARITSEINRRQLIEDLARWSGQPLYAENYPTWRSVFNLLLDLQPPSPLVVVLEEFQYLADDAGGIGAVASELNAAWERPRTPRPFLLVLSGSAIGTMEELAAGGGPLYGRFAWQHRLRPFGYWHSAEMTPFTALRDQALAYGIFGGTPRYLAAVDTSRTLAENAARLLLDPRGEVRMLVETALDQEEGLRDVAKYRAILRSVASGSTQRNDIAQRTGLANDAALRVKLARLEELGYIETRSNIDARPNEALRYGIADPAFRFYQRFVEPAISMLARYPADQVWPQMVAPHLNQYMGREFERIAVQAYDRHCVSEGLPLVQRWGRWEGIDRQRQSLKIDLVAEQVDGGVLTGALKWNEQPVEARVFHNHVDMLRRAADTGRRWAHRALENGAHMVFVASGGVTDEFRAAASQSPYTVTIWALSDLYQ
ncbi:MAG: ATP-binding protein [Rhodothermales bacterium]